MPELIECANNIDADQPQYKAAAEQDLYCLLLTKTLSTILQVTNIKSLVRWSIILRLM